MIAERPSIVFFKCLGSRHIYKEIKLQVGVKGIDNTLCKTDLNLISATHPKTYILKSALVHHCIIHNFYEIMLCKWVVFFDVMWVPIPVRSY